MTSANDLRPEFDLLIDGKEVPEGKREDVISIEVNESLDRLAKATIVFRNWDEDQNTPSEDEDSFKLTVGHSVVLSLGWGSDLTEVFDGMIIAVRTQYRTDCPPTLELHCRCRGIGLVGAPQYRVWQDQSDFDAISSICSEVGLKAKGPAGFVHPFLIQNRISDWEFITMRAKALGLMAFVRGKDLIVTTADSAAETSAQLTWPNDLMEIDLTQDLTRTFGNRTLQSWNPTDKQVTQTTAPLSGGRWPLADRPDPKIILADAKLTKGRERRTLVSTPLQQAELDAWGQSLVDQSRANSYYGFAKFHGNPKARVATKVELTGVGSAQNGGHLVTAALHKFSGSSYTTKTYFGKTPGILSSKEGSQERVIQQIDSLVIAIVESFEDSEVGQGRVLLRFPWMSEEEPPVWARLSTPSAGAGRGFVFIPEPEDEVLVQFVEGDPRFPIVVGSLWNGQDSPPDTYDPELNSKRSIVSRAGHNLVFDDGEDHPGALLESSAKQSIHIDDTSGAEAIILADKTGNEIKMDANGISLTVSAGKEISLNAPGGIVSITAKDISAAADASVEVKANATVGIQSSGQLKLQGAQVTLDGDAMLSAKAPMIQLN